MQDRVRLEKSWKEVLGDEFEQPYMKNLRSFLKQQIASGRTLFPEGRNIFAALDAAPLDQVKVVILGQDPYHGPGQAHGLCFSVLPTVPLPPSLRNIYKEIALDLGYSMPKHGFLGSWASQGVLLLNAVLTVEKGMANSHQGKGWEQFTDRIIQVLNQKTEGLVFMLWGGYAQKKGGMIDGSRHLVLKAPHPSPLSAHRGFFGCRHFSRANEYLMTQGKDPIDWRIPEKTPGKLPAAKIPRHAASQL